MLSWMYEDVTYSSSLFTDATDTMHRTDLFEPLVSAMQKFSSNLNLSLEILTVFNCLLSKSGNYGSQFVPHKKHKMKCHYVAVAI